MSNSLIKKTTKLLGGSAIAGFGFSFGRDIYRGTKKNKDSIFMLLVALAAMVGTYLSGLWITRNYQTVAGSVFKRIGALIIFVPSFVITACVMGFLAFIITSFGDLKVELYRLGPIELYVEDANNYESFGSSLAAWEAENAKVTERQREWDQAEADRAHKQAAAVNNPVNILLGVFSGGSKEEVNKNIVPATSRPEVRPKPKYKPQGAADVPEPVDFIQIEEDGRIIMGQNTFFGICGSLSFFVIGGLMGFTQRNRRSKLWKAESANQTFFEKYGLSEDGEGMLHELQTGQIYRIEDANSKRITLFPKGTRGKRAYILIDAEGKFSDFTGIQKI